MTEEPRKFLTIDEAKKAMKPGKQVHTFRSSTNMLVGCDWSRAHLLEILEKHSETIQRGGEMCSKMGHGLVVFDDQGPLFIETRDKPSWTDQPGGQ